MTPVILDTSVVVAAHLSAHGAANDLLSAFYSDRLQVGYTPAMLAEFGEVLARPKFAAFVATQSRIAFLMKLRASGRAFTPALVPVDSWPDKNDLPFVAAALATPERILVTLNPRDFAPAVRHGVRVLSPSAAKRLLL